jgi:hypothetical protein
MSAVVTKRIVDHYVVAPGHGSETTGEILLFVFGEYKNRNHRAVIKKNSATRQAKNLNLDH